MKTQSGSFIKLIIMNVFNENEKGK